MKIEKNINLNEISEDDLLNVRICDLPLQIKDTWLEECILELFKELESKNISFKPFIYLADEWLTPQNETCIGIPFYLAHPRLIALERKFMIDAEGDTKEGCMKLLRHEAGHAVCYAYQFHKRNKWKKIFGPSDLDYGDTYKYRPYSKNYVHHLDGYYAQHHPEDDFVETFSVWLTPQIDWRMQYKGWKALSKLNYVEELMNEIKNKEPKIKSNKKFWRLSTLKITLKSFYKKKRRFLAEDFPDFHDVFLKANFLEKKENNNLPEANNIIKKYRNIIINSVCHSSGEKKYIINELISDIKKRAKELNLVYSDEEWVLAIKLTGYITSLIMNYLYTGRFIGKKSKFNKKES